jgi:hypothetical protein
MKSGPKAVAGIKRPRRLLLKLLLPGTNLVRVNLVTLRRISHRRLLPQSLKRDLRLQTSIYLPSYLRHNPLRLLRRNG